MTALTVVAEPAPMDVVAAMTIAAAGAEFGRIARPGVAGRANEPLVLSGQCEAGLGIVVEAPHLPIGGVVAIAAFGWRTQCSLMMRILVAIGASRARRGESLVLVTRLAFDLRMLAEKRERSQRMVETDIGFPVVGIVTAPARRAQFRPVYVVFVMTGGTLRDQFDLVRSFHMAILAASRRVFAQQREVGHRVVVEIDFLPIVFGVASGAIGAVAALVSVVFLVASDTSGRRRGDLGRLHVAALAGRAAMRAAQRKLGHSVMVEFDPVPRPRDVAIAALRSVFSLVGIVVLVAAVAIAWRFLDRVAGPMARLARGLRVPADQGKAGTIVIESHLPPPGGRMATRAVRAAASAVDVVLGMARVAGLRQPLPALSLVAAHAVRPCMCAGQGKSGLGVIEGLDRAPSGDRVAILAPCADPAAVRIVGLVTPDTGGWCQPVGLTAGMAGRTADRPVLAAKRVVGLVVVESGGVEAIDIEPASLVFGMARAAGAAPRGRVAPVKTDAAPDIRCHRLVAGSTPAAFRFLAKAFVTGAAILFEPGMSVRKRAGAHQLFDDRLPERRYRRYQEQQGDEGAYPGHQY